MTCSVFRKIMGDRVDMVKKSISGRHNEYSIK